MAVIARRRHFAVVALLGALALAALAPAEAQDDFQPLFDKLNVRLEGSWVGLSTQFRLDSEILGEGTTLRFEDDLQLASNKTIPALSFEWQIARKHKLGVRWQDIKRDSSSQVLTEIQWGDETIPVNADITLGFDITQYFVDYTFFPWVTESWAAGFGLGVRVMEISATLAWDVEGIGDVGGSSVQGTGPLPYIYFEYRSLFSESWRFITGLGWLSVEIDDIKGGQWVGRASIEYLLGDHWGFGGAINIATVDVDWRGVQTQAGESVLTAGLDMDINDLSVFVRVRF